MLSKRFVPDVLRDAVQSWRKSRQGMPHAMLAVTPLWGQMDLWGKEE